MRQVGTFPTAYGVSVPVFDAENPSDPEMVLFSADATAICAGIYDPKERARFVADMKALGRCDLKRLADYGGHTVRRIAIFKPTEPAYPQIPNSGDAAMPIENWVDLIMDKHRWCDRADALLDIIGGNIAAAAGWEEILALGIQIMLTGTLEHLAEHEIDCLEAAAFYSLTVHPEWSNPAMNWLRPVSTTWFKDWVAARPAYKKLAVLCGYENGLPSSYQGGGRG